MMIMPFQKKNTAKEKEEKIVAKPEQEQKQDIKIDSDVEASTKKDELEKAKNDRDEMLAKAKEANDKIERERFFLLQALKIRLGLNEEVGPKPPLWLNSEIDELNNSKAMWPKIDWKRENDRIDFLFEQRNIFRSNLIKQMPDMEKYVDKIALLLKLPYFEKALSEKGRLAFYGLAVKEMTFEQEPNKESLKGRLAFYDIAVKEMTFEQGPNKESLERPDPNFIDSLYDMYLFEQGRKITAILGCIYATINRMIKLYKEGFKYDDFCMCAIEATEQIFTKRYYAGGLIESISDDKVEYQDQHLLIFSAFIYNKFDHTKIDKNDILSYSSLAIEDNDRQDLIYITNPNDKFEPWRHYVEYHRADFSAFKALPLYIMKSGLYKECLVDLNNKWQLFLAKYELYAAPKINEGHEEISRKLSDYYIYAKEREKSLKS